MADSGNIQVLVETEDLNISYQAGAPGTDRTLLIFAGIGRDPTTPQRPEFVRNMQQLSLPHEVYFIADKRRSWFNATANTICDFLTPRLAGRRVFTLGNSMGGFGAILFANLLPGVEAAVAFAPQYSVHREVVRAERRWENFTARIDDWQHLTCLPAQLSDAKIYIFQGMDAVLDLNHVKLFDRALTHDMTMFLIRHGTHETAVYLRDLGVLHRIVEAVVQNGATRLELDGLLKAGGAPHRTVFRPAPKPKAAPPPDAPPPPKRRMDYIEVWDALRLPQRAGRPAAAGATALEILADTPDFYVARRKGNPDTQAAVLLFSSAAENPALPQRRQFTQHVSEMRVPFDTYFIIDKKRTWFNAIAGEILAVLKPELGGKDVYTFGNSIGGFGAILFSHLLENCQYAVAFDPQYSMHREVVRKERRWSKFFSEIKSWQYVTCMPEPFADRPILVVQSSTKDSDSLHAANFIDNVTPGMTILTLEACSHDACGYLNENKLLRGVIRCLVEEGGDIVDVQMLLRNASIKHRRVVSPLATTTVKRGRVPARKLPPRRGRDNPMPDDVPEVVS